MLVAGGYTATWGDLTSLQATTLRITACLSVAGLVASAISMIPAIHIESALAKIVLFAGIAATGVISYATFPTADHVGTQDHVSAQMGKGGATWTSSEPKKPITEILLPAPNSLGLTHSKGDTVVGKGLVTVKSLHVSTWAGPNNIYLGSASSDVEFSTVLGAPLQRTPNISIRFTFDEGTVLDSGTIGYTRGPDVKFAIPKGAKKVTAIEVSAAWTAFDETTFETSKPDSLKWSVDVPLETMGMVAPSEAKSDGR